MPDLAGNDRWEKKMRFIQICGLATIAAVLALALAVSPASAGTSALCISNEGGEDVCKAGNQLGELHYVDPEVKILTSSQNVTCESLFEGTAFGLFEEAVKITGTFTYTNCNGSCQVEQLTESEFSLLKTQLNEGTMVSTTAKFKVTCLFINCVYNWENLTVGATAATPPTSKGKLTVSEQVLKTSSGSACPMTSKLHTKLESLTNVYIKK
jgi:hypothetical protein